MHSHLYPLERFELFISLLILNPEWSKRQRPEYPGGYSRFKMRIPIPKRSSHHHWDSLNDAHSLSIACSIQGMDLVDAVLFPLTGFRSWLSGLSASLLSPPLIRPCVLPRCVHSLPLGRLPLLPFSGFDHIHRFWFNLLHPHLESANAE
jgi:hypothetical protein